MPRGVYIRTEENRKNLSNSLIGLYTGEKNPMFGKRHSEKTREKLSKSHKGKSSGMKGKHHTKANAKKISERTKERMDRPDVRERMKKNHIGMEGKHHNEETKIKIGIKNRQYRFKFI